MNTLTWAGAAVIGIAVVIVFGSAVLGGAGFPIDPGDKQWLEGLVVGAAAAGGGGYALGRRDASNAGSEA